MTKHRFFFAIYYLKIYSQDFLPTAQNVTSKSSQWFNPTQTQRRLHIEKWEVTKAQTEVLVAYRICFLKSNFSLQRWSKIFFCKCARFPIYKLFVHKTLLVHPCTSRWLHVFNMKDSLIIHLTDSFEHIVSVWNLHLSPCVLFRDT